MKRGKIILRGGDIVTPRMVLKSSNVLIEDGIIKSISERDAAETHPEISTIDCRGKSVFPGFIDVHTHGGAGFDFGDEDERAYEALSEYYFSHGVTSVLATLAPLPHELLGPAVRRLAAYLKRQGSASNIVGIHLEGPYINRTMSGGNKKEYIEEPDLLEFRKVLDAGEGFIKLITVAPELDGIDDVISEALTAGVVVALGHSNADSRTATKAIELGASQVTHLFNAMPGLHHRKQGITSAMLLSDAIDAQIIADGIHVHPDFIRLAVKVKSPDRILLITDSMRASGLPDGVYDSAGNAVRVVGGISRMPDGTLAGSTLAFEKGVALVAGFNGVDLPELSRMASTNAARSIGTDYRAGSLEEGKEADIVVLDKDFKVSLTMKRGEVRFQGGVTELRNDGIMEL
jgi:N-acetylglucosamine-6-phosphate deacetylase